MIEKRIADKIKHVRTTNGLTLADLSEATGLSRGQLSRIENNRVSPPVSTLARISRGLGVPISVFFEEDGAAEESHAVTRVHQRRQVVRRGTKLGYTYYLLTNLTASHVIEPMLVKYPVSGKAPSTLFDHPGEEFVFVLKGELEVVYGKKKIRLRQGDTIHFDAAVPHRGQNVGTVESECLVIVVAKRPE
jgi:transcriptional regulator with XRE-family HTH domain